MSRIETAVEQDQIADSLIDPEGARPLSELFEHFDDAADERMAEEWGNTEQVDFAEGSDVAEQEQVEVDYEPARQQFRDEVERNQILNDAEASLREQAQQPRAEPEWTPAEVVQGVQQLKQGAIDSGLVSQETTQQLASDYAPAGIDAEVINFPKLDLLLGAIALSGENGYRMSQGDSTKLGNVHPDAARIHFAELSEALMMDPTTSGNAAQAAVATQGAYFGFREAVDKYGIDAPLYLLNPGEGAEWALNNIVQAYQPGAPRISREVCLAMTNPIVERWRSHVRTILAAEQTERSSARGQRSTRKAQFQTNDEIFGDPEVLERISRERL